MKSASLLSILFSLLLLPSGAVSALGGVLYVSPERGVHAIGETFDVQILADTGVQAINAAEAELIFNPDVLSVERISTGNSILQTWPTPVTFSNVVGTVEFSGVTTGKFSGTGGVLITITFKALRNMQSDARLSAGALLAADGVESNIITTMRSGVFTIQPLEIPAQSDIASSSDGIRTSSFEAPLLDTYQNEVRVGERIVVKGSAAPRSTISMWIQRGNEDPARVDIDADGDGSFTFVSDLQAREGVYHLWAFAMNSSGAHSDSSNRITVTARSSELASSASLGVSLLANLTPFLTLLVVGGLCTGYLFHRHKIAKMKLEIKK